MKRLVNAILLLSVAVFLGGCSLSPDEKVSREQALKQAIDSFVANVVQSNWNDAYRLCDDSFPNADRLKTQITQSWVPDATLTSGEIASMAWVTDSTAKVKLTWTFQSGSVQTFSNETFVWVWKGNNWKYRGRAIR
jgi:hypothetical protein